MANPQESLKPVPVRRRSAARLAVVQVAYQQQMSGESLVDFLPIFLKHYVEDIVKAFRGKDVDHTHLNALAAGIEANAESLDKAVSACLSADWSLDRLTVIDRAILHAGTFELKEMPHLPARAVVSEYAAIADVCGSDVGFINAVLDRVARQARSVEMDRERANV